LSQVSGKFILNSTITLDKLNQSGAVLNQKMIWSGSQWVPYTDIYTKATTTVQNITSTTHQNITELVSDTLPVGLYQWIYHGVCQSTNTGVGLGLRLNVSTAASNLCNGKWSIAQAAAGTASNFVYDQLNTSVNITSASVAAANSDFIVRGEGIINITSSGTVVMQARGETATSVSIRPGSYLVFKRLS
jgi:hypothetical protein